jgi:DNA-binding MarR family transcriptional regulator
MKKAGGILLAKTDLPEFSSWIESGDLLSGRSNNPWDLDRTPGGSSGGGSAAVAAGLSPLGLGTDLAISVRGPAAQTGIVSLKATHGRGPMTGIWPRAPRRFWHVGRAVEASRAAGDPDDRLQRRARGTTPTASRSCASPARRRRSPAPFVSPRPRTFAGRTERRLTGSGSPSSDPLSVGDTARTPTRRGSRERRARCRRSAERSRNRKPPRRLIGQYDSSLSYWQRHTDMERAMSPAPGRLSENLLRSRRAWSGLVVEVFRLNGDLIEAGDMLVRDLDLTSARWQVLGAIALSPVPLPVAHIARNMGLARQSVQRIVDDIRDDGLVQLEPNPHHRRAPLVAMTPAGVAAYERATERKDLWADVLTEGLSPEAIEAASTVLRTLQQRIGASHGHIASIADATRKETQE